jgi:hypothetical protein
MSGKEPPQVMTGEEVCLAFFLLLELVLWVPTRWIVYGNDRDKFE